MAIGTGLSVGVTLTLMTRGFGSLGLIARQFGSVNQGAAQLQDRLNKIHALATGGAVVAGFGIALGVGMLRAANDAGNLALALKGVQIAGNYTNTQMKSLQDTVFAVSNITSRSALEVAQWMRIVANGSTFTAAQLQKVMPVVAKFADVLYFTKGTPFAASIQMGTRFAHLFQLYDPAQLTKGLNMLASASRLIPGGPQELLTQASYAAPVSQALGVPPDQLIAAVALMNRLGMSRGRAGTGLANLLQFAIPTSAYMTSSRSSKQLEALSSLGLLTRGPGGKPLPIGMSGGGFDLVQYLQGLAASYVRATQGKTGQNLGLARATWMSEVHNAFNIQGGRLAAVMGALPASMQQLLIILHKFQSDMDVATAQSKLLETWNVQMSRMTTNLRNVFIKLFLPFVEKDGPKILQSIGDAFGRLGNAITPDRAMMLVKIFGAVAAAATIAGGLMLLSAAVSAFALLAGPIGLVAGAVAGLSFILVRYGPQMAAFFANLGKQMTPFFNWAKGVIGPQITILSKSFGEFMMSFAGFGKTMAPILVPVLVTGFTLLGKVLTITFAASINAVATAFQVLARMITMIRNALNWAGNLGSGSNPNSSVIDPNTGLPRLGPLPAPNPGPAHTFIHHGDINIYANTNDPKALARKIIQALDPMARDYYRASGAGVNHPLIPAVYANG